METNPIECQNCSKHLPVNGFFCGGCLTQFKCKECGSLLDKENAGCIECGTPRLPKTTFHTPNSQHNTNTFRLHETLTDRTIEATFSDTVGKDLSEILRDAYSTKVKERSTNNFSKQIDYSSNNESKNFQEPEVLSNSNATNQNDNQNSTITAVNDYPSLKAIAMKNLPNSETEWVLVYSFYASKYGQEIFSRQDILDKYGESNRLSNDKKQFLSRNIIRVVQAGYINPLTSDYSILDEGIMKAKEIITRTTSSAPKHKPSKNKKDDTSKEVETKIKKSTSGGKNLKRLTDIDFEPSGQESLKSFFSKYSPKNDNERNLLFVFYLREMLKITEITFNHIYTCYDQLELKISENLPQTVRNAASRTGWIEIKNSFLFLTIKGGNQIKTWNKKD